MLVHFVGGAIGNFDVVRKWLKKYPLINSLACSRGFKSPITAGDALLQDYILNAEILDELLEATVTCM